VEFSSRERDPVACMGWPLLRMARTVDRGWRFTWAASWRRRSPVAESRECRSGTDSRMSFIISTAADFGSHNL
jgi:hypothetical protein